MGASQSFGEIMTNGILVMVYGTKSCERKFSDASKQSYICHSYSRINDDVTFIGDESRRNSCTHHVNRDDGVYGDFCDEKSKSGEAIRRGM